MSEDLKHIDKVFKEASQDFSSPAPSGAWEHIAGSLKAQRRARMIKRVAVLLALAVIIVLLLWQCPAGYKSNPGASPAAPAENASPATAHTVSSHSVDAALQQKTQNIQPTKAKAAAKSSTIAAAGETAPPALQTRISKAANAEVREQQKDAKQPKNQQNKADYKSQNKPANDERDNPSVSGAAHPAQPEKTSSSAVAEISSNRNRHKKQTDSLSNQEPSFSGDTATTTPALPEAVMDSIKTPAAFSVKTGITASWGYGPAGLGFSSVRGDYFHVAGVNNEKGKGSGAFDIKYYLTYRHWYFETGLRLFSIKTRGGFGFPSGKIHYVPLKDFGLTAAGYYDIYNLEEALLKRGWNTVDYLRQMTYTETKVSLIDIPLMAGWYHSRGRWSYLGRAGISLSIPYRGTVVSGDREGEILYGELQGLKKQALAVGAGAGLYYKISPSLTAGISMDGLFYVTNMSTTTGIVYKPLKFSFGPRLRWEF